MGKQVELLALIDRIDVFAPCPKCGHSLTLTHVPINTALVCSECSSKFIINDNTTVRLPRVLQKLKVCENLPVAPQRIGCKRVNKLQRRVKRLV